MDIYQATEFIQNLYPNKVIDFGFDDKCVQMYEINLINASPETPQFIQYNKLKAVIPDVADPMYAPISSHRNSSSWSEMKVVMQALIDNN